MHCTLHKRGLQVCCSVVVARAREAESETRVARGAWTGLTVITRYPLSYYPPCAWVEVAGLVRRGERREQRGARGDEQLSHAMTMRRAVAPHIRDRNRGARCQPSRVSPTARSVGASAPECMTPVGLGSKVETSRTTRRTKRLSLRRESRSSAARHHPRHLSACLLPDQVQKVPQHTDDQVSSRCKRYRGSIDRVFHLGLAWGADRAQKNEERQRHI